MDPSETLKRIQALAAKIIKQSELRDEDTSESLDAYELAENVEALDGWLKRGGFLPKSWETK
jgi:hypothetical protein